MNKLRIVLLSLILLMFSSYTFLAAQDSNPPGFIVLKSGDTMYGKVNYIKEKIVFSTFYKRIRITDTNGKTKKYKRENVVSFRLNGFDYESFWLRQPSPSFPRVSLVNPRYNINFRKGEHHFLKVISKGNLSHYELEWIEQEDNDVWSMSLLKKEEDTFFIRANQGWLGLKRKILVDYFFNCQKLKNKIEKRELNKVWQVVEFYNSRCLD